LITKSFDDQFGIAADGWQTEVKKLLYQLRKCETDEEFEACSEFVLRKIAENPMLGERQSTLRAQVLRFVKRRIDCAALWVLKDQLLAPTEVAWLRHALRALMATTAQQIESMREILRFTSTKRHSQAIRSAAQS